MVQRPFRFGVQASRMESAKAWIDFARQVESLGYSVLTMPDHFSDQLAPVPALMAAADATTTLRVGALVWDNDYRHPAMLAKELATLDLLSEGRLEVGIGAGWQKVDYDHTGIPYDPPGVRVDRFVEGVRVIKGLFADGPLTFAGEYYTITDYDGMPKPLQKFPPILIGGGGKRVLTIAAREADIVGINGNLRSGIIGPDAIASMTAEAVDEKVALVKAAAGERPIELNVRSFVMNVTDSRIAVAENLASMVGFTDEAVLASPFVLVGTTNQIIDDLQARRERWGFSYVIVGPDEVEAFAPVVEELAGN
jgi:probable F420-dependent oxidoreductase